MLRLFHKALPEVVTININSEDISFAWFQSKKNDLPILKNYKRIDIEDYFVHNLEIFSFIKLQEHLNLFIKYNKLSNPFIYISLENEQIIEQLSKENDCNLEVQDYALNFYEILDQKNNFFYICRIKHSLIFQYKLLSIKSGINLSKVVSGNFIRLSILKKYLPTSLENIVHIKDIQNQFTNFVDYIDLKKYMIISDEAIDINKEKKNLLKNMGIYLLKDF